MIDAENKRSKKGKSLIDVFQDFTAIDIETTGFDPQYDSIIELGAVRYRDGVPVAYYDQLINPGFSIDGFISDLTGITNEMLSEAPQIEDVLQGYLDFIGEDVLVGHNVNFDINFLYDNCINNALSPIKNDFVDTMRISKRINKDWENHKLDTLIKNFSLQERKAHRADDDAALTAECYLRLVQSENFAAAKEAPKRKRPAVWFTAGSILPEPGHEDESSVLYGAVCVFTGALEKMVRKDAMQLVVNIGGKCADSVTKKTNFLILGNNDYCKTIKEGKSTKQKKAEELIKTGADLKIISEDVFYDLVLDE